MKFYMVIIAFFFSTLTLSGCANDASPKNGEKMEQQKDEGESKDEETQNRKKAFVSALQRLESFLNRHFAENSESREKQKYQSYIWSRLALLNWKEKAELENQWHDDYEVLYKKFSDKYLEWSSSYKSLAKEDEQTVKNLSDWRFSVEDLEEELIDYDQRLRQELVAGERLGIFTKAEIK